MSPGQRALQSFLTDGLRMASDTLALLERMWALEVVHPGSQASEQVLHVFQVVHTLKGTATMIPEGGEIVQALQGFEAMLACRSIEASAAHARDWLESGIQALRATRSALGAILLKHQATLASLSGGLSFSIPQDQVGHEPLGIVLSGVGSDSKRKVRSLWFAMESVGKVFDVREVSRKVPLICWQGRWVPVVGDLRSARICVGILSPAPASGPWVVASPRLEAVMTETEARASGVRDGMDWLSPPKRRLRVA